LISMPSTMFCDINEKNYKVNDACFSPIRSTVNSETFSKKNFLSQARPNLKISSGLSPLLKILTGSSPIYEVIRLGPTGDCTILYVRRRDLIKANYLQPRDLRRIDPHMALSRTLQGQTLLVKEMIMIINIGGVKILCSAEKALLFDPSSLQSRRFLEILIPKLRFGIRPRQKLSNQQFIMNEDKLHYTRHRGRQPFELEMIETTLMIATGWLDSELVSVTRRLHQTLTKLPRFINPKNLEDLRKVKSVMVELESRADALRELLEELLDDEDELRKFNISSRPIRQVNQQRRDRERLDRKLEREKIALEGADEEEDIEKKNTMRSYDSCSKVNLGNKSSNQVRKNGTNQDNFIAKRLENRKILKENNLDNNISLKATDIIESEDRKPTDFLPGGKRDQFSNMTEEELLKKDYEDAIEDLNDEKEAEKELDEIEDLLEYYLQRAVTTQAEAERSLQLARDLEESISVNLSARRFEVNRLELTLAIGSFAVASGALIAGIFGMNLKSYVENSSLGFFAVCSIILFTIFLIGFLLYRQIKTKRIF